MSAEILINIRPSQTRVAYMEDGTLSDLKIEKRRSSTLVGSIYKGKVLRVLPGMQAAFVDIGLNRAAFLYVGDIKQNPKEEEAYVEGEESAEVFSKEIDEERKEIPLPPIQDLIKAGDMVLVQIAKAPLGSKGARITTHVSLPGRNLVYMPELKHLGISRKIEDEEERERLKKLIEKLKPNGGVIVRTAGEGITAEEMTSDLDYLNRMWTDVKKNYGKRKTQGLVYAEIDVELRALRDLLSDDVSRVLVDSVKAHKKIVGFLSQYMPKFKKIVELYKRETPLFDLYDIDLEISRALHRKVWLKSGGYLVIDEAEALVVVDVNTGRYVGKKDLEDTIFQTNQEAVKEIAHQLRIRNCGGIVIIDFIDMERETHREKILDDLAEQLKKDRTRTEIITMSPLGLVEMTRKRTRPSLVSSLCDPCPYCDGKSYVKNKATVANEIFRAIEREGPDEGEGSTKVVTCSGQVADWVYEEEDQTLEFIEEKIGQSIVFKVDPGFHVEEFELRTERL